MTAMTEHIFTGLHDEWRHVTGHFRHAPPTVEAAHPQPLPQEPVMPLSDTASDLASTSAALKTSLGTVNTAMSEAQASHSRLEQLISDVGEIAKIADTPLVAAAAGALHCPPEVVDGFVKSLSAIGAAWPKPEPAAETPAQPEAVQPEAAPEPQPA